MFDKWWLSIAIFFPAFLPFFSLPVFSPFPLFLPLFLSLPPFVLPSFLFRFSQFRHWEFLQVGSYLFFRVFFFFRTLIIIFFRYRSLAYIWTYMDTNTVTKWRSLDLNLSTHFCAWNPHLKLHRKHCLCLSSSFSYCCPITTTVAPVYAELDSPTYSLSLSFSSSLRTAEWPQKL